MFGFKKDFMHFKTKSSIYLMSPYLPGNAKQYMQGHHEQDVRIALYIIYKVLYITCVTAKVIANIK